jgi:hypothetical protein
MKKRTLALTFALLTAPSPALAYTIYLKDGSTIVSPTKYEVDGNRAIITLPSGTKTFLDLAEIDVPRTDRENLTNIGDAKVVGQDGTVTTLVPDQPKPREKPTLQDLVAQRRASAQVAEAEQIKRPVPVNDAPLPRTPAGSVDLSRLPGSPFHDLELAAEVSRFFAGNSIEGISIYQGTARDRILIEVTVASEASVFNALKTAANAMVKVGEVHGDAIAAIELNLVTQRRQRAGQFTLTPDLAQQLASRSIELTEFFVRYVEF